VFNRRSLFVGASLLTLLAACDGRPTAPNGNAGVSRVAGAANGEVTNAVYTITNSAVDGTGHCLNGPEDGQNCNLYDAKEHVWLGGEGVVSSNHLPNGTYFFAVLQPGGQQSPNDGSAETLSDLTVTTHTGAGDDYTNRTFTLTDGEITYWGTHGLDNNRIRLFPYDDTPNPGGEYIMAVCSLADGYPVTPSNCKYDAFKVKTDAPPPPPEAAALTASKTAAGAYRNTYTWAISKAVDRTTVKQQAGSATVNYTVTVTHDAGTISGVRVTGEITITNPNASAVAISGVTDQLSNGTSCTVSGVPAALAPGATTLAYSCALTSLPSTPLDNNATVTWAEQGLSDEAHSHLAAGSVTASVTGIAFTETVVDGSATITDTFAGTLGTLTRESASPTAFTYPRTIAVAANTCTTFGNTATFTTNTTGATGSASQSVLACGNIAGGLTIGFWQNKNGQVIIAGDAVTAGACNVAGYLRGYAPFQDLSATATCANVASYAMNVIKAANASGASMNAMLKAQMLATALDVYFSTAGLGGNKIASPVALGGVKIDLTSICSSITNCANTYANVSAAFNGATSLTVNQLLTYAASQSDAGGANWYGQVKTVQELAKNTFDAINNSVAIVAP
jgi:hypothetical protein